MLKLPLIEKLTTIRIGENDVAFGLLSLKHDLIIFVIILALFILSLMMREYLVSVSIRLISLLLIIFWALDILVLHFFTTRLSVADLKKFSGQWVAIETFVAQIFPDRPWLIFLVIAVTSILMILYVFTKANPAGKKTITTLTLITICLFAISLKPDPTSYVHPWTYQNVIEINMKQGITNKFSPELSAYLGRTPSPLEMRTNCVDGRNERPNVILLLFESLSMYHSQVFSGLPSLTPHFDRIARENSSYTNFFSNGFTTESALISLFTGKHMLPPTSGYATASWDSAYFYRGFHKPTDSLPRIFRRNGYHTGFITTGDLGFLNKGDWLHDIGFDFLEGAENPFYEGWPRLHFRAAPDEALYQRTLQILEELDQERPYFLTVETVSTHQPFYNPYTS